MNEMKTIYIAGPMRGYVELNFPAFFAAEDRIKEREALRGVVILNPARLDKEVDGGIVFPLAHYIERDVKCILKSTGIYMLKDWENSIGARTEHALAVWLKLDIDYE